MTSASVFPLLSVSSSCRGVRNGHHCHAWKVWQESWLQRPGQQQLLPRLSVLHRWRPRLYLLCHWHGVGLQESDRLRAGSGCVSLQRCREVSSSLGNNSGSSEEGVCVCWSGKLCCAFIGISVILPTTHPCTWATAAPPLFTCLPLESLMAGKTWDVRCRPSSVECWSCWTRRRKRSTASSTSTKAACRCLPVSLAFTKNKRNCT